MVKTRARVACCLALTAGFIVGCRNEATNFNQAIVDAVKRIDQTAKPFFEGVYAVASGERDPTELRRARDEFKEALADIKRQAKVLKVPSAITSMNFYECFQRLLKTEEHVLSGMDDILAVVEDRNLSAAAKREAIEWILNALGTEETAIREELRIRQHAFATEHTARLKK